MKLLHRATRDFLLATTVILVFAGVGLYFFLKKLVKEEMQEQLRLQAAIVSEEWHSGQHLRAPFAQIDLTSLPVTAAPVFGDTLIYDAIQHEHEGYHYLKQVNEIDGQRYQIMVMTTYIGWDKYYKTIFYVLLFTVFILAASGVLINYVSNKRIWGPFFLNLQRLKQYSVSNPAPLQLYDSPIKEFNELRMTLKDLADRSRREYISLREFTENASHEIQTPLGIILSKLDRMSQLEVNEEMAQCIVQAKSGVERLSRMNKNLLLLAKLDNNAFESRTPIRMDELLQQHLTLMDDLFAPKAIHFTVMALPTVVYADPYLCDILISNLLVNAIRHTRPSGSAYFKISPAAMVFSNEAPPLDFPVEQLFGRFKKGVKNNEFTGLGLAIVKEICNFYDWNILYKYEGGHHSFIISF
ncbi:HAMP domain-containing histidine kinase [Chitinophaga pendula]|uniref:sensor histidine kinase n=1 Tax=Chitinophaga TaxID=79328 RepID=UPI000BB0C309|nr:MULTISPECIES: HAMP domain-containing sensor histidine kinase [Chitinophaga]ASZ13042.1 hypothetical protein CK934_19790 [Chitinophaga sp. MD30]UCJ09334.1 HAMP domain-containing histidine kinase [Chitinophaga pendula]